MFRLSDRNKQKIKKAASLAEKATFRKEVIKELKSSVPELD
nr:MAG TPA: hypothetical protein [Caudoviricetes sp.]